MEFSFEPGQATYRIEAYDKNGILINGQIYKEPIVVMPEHLVTPWHTQSAGKLESRHLEKILDFKPEILLLGTGKTTFFPKQEIYQYLAKRGLGLEAMTTQAACRTYAILMAEGRKVAAALFP